MLALFNLPNGKYGNFAGDCLFVMFVFMTCTRRTSFLAAETAAMRHLLDATWL